MRRRRRRRCTIVVYVYLLSSWLYLCTHSIGSMYWVFDQGSGTPALWKSLAETNYMVWNEISIQDIDGAQHWDRSDDSVCTDTINSLLIVHKLSTAAFANSKAKLIEPFFVWLVFLKEETNIWGGIFADGKTNEIETEVVSDICFHCFFFDGDWVAG